MNQYYPGQVPPQVQYPTQQQHHYQNQQVQPMQQPQYPQQQVPQPYQQPQQQTPQQYQQAQQQVQQYQQPQQYKQNLPPAVVHPLNHEKLAQYAAAAQDREQQFSTDDLPFYEWRKGQNVLRLWGAYSERGLPIREVGTHFGVPSTDPSKKPGPVDCLQMTHGMPCPICAALEAVTHQFPQFNTKDYRAKRRGYAWAIDKREMNKGPQIVNFPSGVIDWVYQLLVDTRFSVVNPAAARDLEINKTGAGLNTRYDRGIAPGDTPLAPDLNNPMVLNSDVHDYWCSQIKDLDTVFAPPTEAKLDAIRARAHKLQQFLVQKAEELIQAQQNQSMGTLASAMPHTQYTPPAAPVGGVPMMPPTPPVGISMPNQFGGAVTPPPNVPPTGTQSGQAPIPGVHSTLPTTAVGGVSTNPPIQTPPTAPSPPTGITVGPPLPAPTPQPAYTPPQDQGIGSTVLPPPSTLTPPVGTAPPPQPDLKPVTVSDEPPPVPGISQPPGAPQMAPMPSQAASDIPKPQDSPPAVPSGGRKPCFGGEQPHADGQIGFISDHPDCMNCHDEWDCMDASEKRRKGK